MVEDNFADSELTLIHDNNVIICIYTIVSATYILSIKRNFMTFFCVLVLSLLKKKEASTSS